MFSFSASFCFHLFVSFFLFCLSCSLSSSFRCVRSAPGGGGSGRAGVAAVLCGLRLGDPCGAPVESYSLLHPRQRDQLGQNRGEMGSAHHGCAQEGAKTYSHSERTYIWNRAGSRHLEAPTPNKKHLKQT